MKWIRVFILLLWPGAFALGQAPKTSDTATVDHPRVPDTAHAGRLHAPDTAGIRIRPTSAGASSWSTLQKDKVSLRYPSTWTPNTEGSGMVDFFVLAPPDSSDVRFRENVNLVIQDLGADSAMSLDELVKASLDALQSAFAGFELVSSHQLINARGHYQRFIYKSLQNGYPLEFIQEFQIIRKKAYILTFTSSQGKFDDHQELGEKILQSFAIER